MGHNGILMETIRISVMVSIRLLHPTWAKKEIWFNWF